MASSGVRICFFIIGKTCGGRDFFGRAVMFRKIVKYCYFLVLLAVALLALALGMANDSSVMLNLLAGKTEITVSALMGFSFLAGAVFFSFIWAYIVFIQWVRIRNLRRRIRRMEKNGIPAAQMLAAPADESVPDPGYSRDLKAITAG